MFNVQCSMSILKIFFTAESMEIFSLCFSVFSVVSYFFLTTESTEGHRDFYFNMPTLSVGMLIKCKAVSSAFNSQFSILNVQCADAIGRHPDDIRVRKSADILHSKIVNTQCSIFNIQYSIFNVQC